NALQAADVLQRMTRRTEDGDSSAVSHEGGGEACGQRPPSGSHDQNRRSAIVQACVSGVRARDHPRKARWNLAWPVDFFSTPRRAWLGDASCRRSALDSRLFREPDLSLATIDIAIIGAGPYGLSLAAHLRDRGRSFRVFGSPMRFWSDHMPAGMC